MLHSLHRKKKQADSENRGPPTLEHGFEEANETTDGSVLRKILTHI